VLVVRHVVPSTQFVFWFQDTLFGRSGLFVRYKRLKEMYSGVSVGLLEINLHLMQRIGQNKTQSTFTFTSRILHCPYFENSQCWPSYIQTLYISSIRHETSCVFRYLVLGKWSFYLPSNQINAVPLSDVYHQSPFYFSFFKSQAWHPKIFLLKFMALIWPHSQLTWNIINGWTHEMWISALIVKVLQCVGLRCMINRGY
jgi:hypothetical protein